MHIIYTEYHLCNQNSQQNLLELCELDFCYYQLSGALHRSRYRSPVSIPRHVNKSVRLCLSALVTFNHKTFPKNRGLDNRVSSFMRPNKVETLLNSRYKFILNDKNTCKCIF